ncbi:FLOT1 protein, partial [Caloenas nicobarica]|nr:FLOT1 protein [Caloenas nicobarica]
QEIYKDRQKFSEQVFNVASSDLVNMGISVVSYTLKDIQDDQVTVGTPGGLGTLGTTRAYRPPGRLGPSPDAWVPPPPWGCHGCSVGAVVVLGVPWVLWVLCVSRGCSLGAGFQVARTQQAIAAQRAQVALVERAQRAQLQEHEVGRRERELEATVRKPAEAERYRLERLAEAQR